MGHKLRHKIYILWVLSLLLLLVAFSIGCRSEAKPPPEAEVSPQVEHTADLTAVPGPINILSATASTDFPQFLRFDLEAESNSEITEIELRYRIKKIATAVVTVTIKPDFTPAKLVESSWTWDTRKARLPPGAEIEYKWVIENAAGDRIETESARLVFHDHRYQWQELVVGKVRLFWYLGNQSFAQELAEAGQTALRELAESTGARLEKQAKIYIYADSHDLRGALVYPQEWTGGVAFTEYGIIAIGISPNNLAWGKRTVAHELAHLVIHQVTFNPYGNLPTWLSEGLAMYAEGDLRKDLKDMLVRAIRDDKLFSVRSLGSRFPAGREDAWLAYAQSYSLVEFLVDKYGDSEMSGLLQVFKQGSSYDDALLRVYGFDIDELDDLWRRSLGLRPLGWFQRRGEACLASTFWRWAFAGDYAPRAEVLT